MGSIKYIMSVMDQFSVKRMLDAARFVHQRSGKSTAFVFADMVYCGLKYNAGYNDYKTLEFDSLTARQRATYVTRGISNQYVAALNDKRFQELFDNKVKFNRLFHQFVPREFLSLEEASPAEFADFLKKHGKVIAKPCDGTNGNGVEAVYAHELTGDDALYQKLRESDRTLVEEYIMQHPDLSALAPESVNTLRLLTLLTGEKVNLIFAGIRMGCGKVADNLGSGGIACAIDPATGRISSPAQDKANHIYERHPVTGVQLPGTQIPFFREAVEMVSEAARVVPQVRYIAWDVAITPDGPTLVEANQYPGHSIYQLKSHLGKDRIGFKPVIDKLIQQ